MRVPAFIFCLFISGIAIAQTCPGAGGNQTTYGTNNQWIGYIYDNADFTNYHGYIIEGTAASPNFDEQFAGDYDSIPVSNGCSVYPETFSIRFKLQQNFAAGDYDIVVAGDDGYRLSIDGGNTWIINEWSEHAYYAKNTRVFLSGTTNLVLEYFENTIANRISFSINAVCTASGSQTIYGSNNQWIGYVYGNENFTEYKGTISEGTPSSPNFYEDFGTTENFFNTSQCPLIAETFSARFRLTKQFSANNYLFTVGGDDGYRLSFDGGATWPIENFVKHSYTTSSKSIFLDGSYNMVLEYFDTDGDNIVSFELKEASLPIQLVYFSAAAKSNTQNQINWSVVNMQQAGHFTIERSADGRSFQSIVSIASNPGNRDQVFAFTDQQPINGNNYYRLKWMEGNSVIYSTVRLVAANHKNALYIFPNPVTDHTAYFTVPNNTGSLTIQLFDATGKQLHQTRYGQVFAGQVLSLQLPTVLPAGNYLLRYSNTEGNNSSQLINIR